MPFLGLIAFIICVAMMAVPVGTIGLLILALKRYAGSPIGHFVTALSWTLITIVQTVRLIYFPDAKTPGEYVALFVAGSVFLASWLQLAERHRTMSRLQERYSLWQRLFMQSVYGPFVLLAVVCCIHIAGQYAFETAAEQKNIRIAFALQYFGAGNAKKRALVEGLIRAVDRQDVEAVSIYLAAGTPKYISYCNEGDTYDQQSALAHAVSRDNTMITELLLNYGRSVKEYKPEEISPLRIAVENNKTNQVRTLLRHGAVAQKNPFISNEENLLDIAKKHGNKEIVALLVQTGQEKAYLK